jgi:uncharacterized membrane protein YphA (DoxX/SURF4 family)
MIGGIQELVDFPEAVAELAHLGVQADWLWVAVAIVVKIGGSALVMFGRWVWLGAGALGVLTAVAMLTANDFWTRTGHDRLVAVNAFFEHLSLIVGLVLIAMLTLCNENA